MNCIRFLYGIWIKTNIRWCVFFFNASLLDTSALNAAAADLKSITHVFIHLFVFQENYERMKVLVDELKSRTEKVKLGRCGNMTLNIH